MQHFVAPPPKKKLTLNSHKDVPSPSGYGSEQTRCKVPGWVDGIAAVEPVGQPNGGDKHANKDWLHALLGLIVVHICDPKDAKEEEECAKELIQKGEEGLNGSQARMGYPKERILPLEIGTFFSMLVYIHFHTDPNASF